MNTVLLEQVQLYASYPQTSVSLKQMVQFGVKPSPVLLLRGAQFLRQELPIRLAHRAIELENLPHGLSKMPSIIKVKNWYLKSFEDLYTFPKPEEFGLSSDITKGLKDCYFNPGEAEETPKVHEYNQAFVNCIETIKKRHDPTTTTIAEGIMEFKSFLKQKEAAALPRDIQAFLDRFYLSRIGIRVLIGQHVTMAKAPPQKDYVGIICTKTKLTDIVTEAIFNARQICQDHYGLCEPPEIKMYGDLDVEFMYVPSHLHHMLFELLKNSLRAVVETHGEECDEYPIIRVIIAQGKEDITIKVSDEGGGIARSGMPLIWTYMYTTASTPLLEHPLGDFRAPLAGFGYGLPLSRLYARYFGGDLRLISMEGYGTDAYLHLSRLSDSEEPLV